MHRLGENQENTVDDIDYEEDDLLDDEIEGEEALGNAASLAEAIPGIADMGMLFNFHKQKLYQAHSDHTYRI